jgi:hypothetical protein
MALAVCGHQRSGTSLLQRLCDHHPDIIMTNEFGNFFDLDEPFSTYRRQIYKRWWRTGNRSFFSPHMRWGTAGFSEVERVTKRTNPLARAVHKPLRIHMLQNLYFVTRYLFKIPGDQRACVGVPAIEAALKCIFTGVRVVGDKHPDYVFVLDRLVQLDGLSCLVIYRDPRDMTNSVLKAYATWGKWWGADLAIAAKIAERWVHTVELMERHADKIHTIRYEDLVTNPWPVLEALGAWLGVDPQEFRYEMIRSSSVGKHRQHLSPQELEDVIRIAGPTMERLGYKI